MYRRGGDDIERAGETEKQEEVAVVIFGAAEAGGAEAEAQLQSKLGSRKWQARAFRASFA